MKQLSILTLIGLFFCACKKEISEQTLQPPDSQAQAKKSMSKIKEMQTLVNDSIWSCSAGEWIYLEGEVMVKVDETITDNKYSSSFTSNFAHVTGTGATTGETYNGGGLLKGQVTASLDENNLSVNASTKEKLHFTHAGVGIDFDVTSRFVRDAIGEVKIDYVTDKSKDCQ